MTCNRNEVIRAFKRIVTSALYMYRVSQKRCLIKKSLKVDNFTFSSFSSLSSSEIQIKIKRTSILGILNVLYIYIVCVEVLNYYFWECRNGRIIRTFSMVKGQNTRGICAHSNRECLFSTQCCEMIARPVVQEVQGGQSVDQIRSSLGATSKIK